MKFPRPRRLRPARPFRHAPLRRGIYLLPTLFTVANMGCGFAATLAAVHDRFLLASWLVVFAAVCDGLDGRIARLTNATSAFGQEYDSLADVVSFGIAPALLAYQWSLRSLGRWGWFAAFVFLVAGTVRLARFNIKAHAIDRRYFMGLPIPAGAGALIILSLVHPEPVMTPPWVLAVWVYVIGISLLMVSTVPYRSFKTLNLRQRWPARAFFAVALAIALPVLLQEVALAVVLAAYLVAGPVEALWRRATGHPINLLVEAEHCEDTLAPADATSNVDHL